MLRLKQSTRLLAALAAVCCLLGAVSAVDIPSNVDFSNKDLPETGELMHGKPSEKRDKERERDLLAFLLVFSFPFLSEED